MIYFEAVDLPELWDFFTALPTTVVVDHMGRPDVTKPIDGPEFSLFLKFMREHENVWSKVSCPGAAFGLRAAGAERRTARLSRRRSVRAARRRGISGSRAVGHRLAASQPERTTCPTTGCWSISFPHIATTAELQQKLLVDNPMRLYWPEQGRN